MTLTFRSITPENIPEAAEIFHRTWQDVFSAWIPAEDVARITLESSIQNLTHITQKSTSKLSTLGGFRDGRLEATVVWGKPREDLGFEIELYSMLVHPKLLRQGMGKKLFLETNRAMREEGVKNFYLNCIDENHRALNFYEAMGGRRLSGSVTRKGYREVRLFWSLDR